jgi:hypothetical protein
LRKGIIKLRQEKRPFINVKQGVWLTPSTIYQADVRDKLAIEELWKELEQATTQERAEDENFTFPRL